MYLCLLDEYPRRNMLILIICFVSTCVIVSGQGPSVEGDIRLAGTNSSQSQGRVEIYHNGIWGTVCDDNFQVDEAIVVCRQLGFQTNLGNSRAVSGVFGAGSGPIWMDDVQCLATETKLMDCQFSNWNRSDCSHSEDVGVVCPIDASVTNPPPQVTSTAPPIVDTGNCSTPDPNIRVRGPLNRPGMGVVQVFRNNQWGGICDNDWDTLDARVVCRMSCYNPQNALAGSVNFDMSNITEPMVIQSVHCNGNEANLNACQTTAGTCQRSEMARVTCVPLDNQPTARPEPILECSTDGLLTVKFSTLRDPDLEPKHLSVAFPGPSSSACLNITKTESIYVVIDIPFDGCGTNRTENDTHIIYKNVVRYLPTSTKGDITNANTYMIEVTCELPRDVVAVTNHHIVPITETVTQAGTGQFVVALNFFRDNGFENVVTNFPLELPLGEWLSASVTLNNVDSTLRLIVPNCYATPSADRNNPMKYPLFTDKCIDDSTVGFFFLNDSSFGFIYQTFKFVQFSEVHLHCDALVCGKEEVDPVCDRSCFKPVQTTTPGQGRRRKRDVIEERTVYHVSSGTLVVYDPNAKPDIIRPIDTEAPPTMAPTTRNPTSASVGINTTQAPVVTRAPSTMVTKTSSTGDVSTSKSTIKPGGHISSQAPSNHSTSETHSAHVTSKEPGHVTSEASSDSATSQMPSDHVPDEGPQIESNLPQIIDNPLGIGSANTLCHLVSTSVTILYCFLSYILA